jgi:hypothetical protein
MAAASFGSYCLSLLPGEIRSSRSGPMGTATTIVEEAVRLVWERLHLAPRHVLFVFDDVEPNHPRFPAASIR